MMEEKKEKKGKKVVLAEPSEGEAYSPRPSRKPDISRRARLEGWHEEGVYLPLSYSRTKAVHAAGLKGVEFGLSQYEIPFEKMHF